LKRANLHREAFYSRLPFRSKSMNKLFQRLFYLANSANYPQKYELFYPLKKQLLLQTYAISDGWDLQTIQKGCWSCNGTGNYYSIGDCYKCGGTGIDSTNQHYLLRFKLGDRVYHTPVYDRPEGEPNDKIDGLVRHSQKISARVGLRACLLLVLIYQPELFWRLMFSNELRYEFGWQWRRRSISTFNCPRSITPIVAIMLLFAGWIPIRFKSYGVYIVPIPSFCSSWSSLEHLQWILRAWMPGSSEFNDIPF
jgi:hypothetical protein